AKYQQQMKWAATRQEKGKTIQLPYPYQEMKPLEMYRAILADYPGDPIASRVKHEIANWLEIDGRQAEAQKAYEELAAGDPADPWVKSAIATLAQRRRPHVGFDWWTTTTRAAFHLPSERVK